MVNMNLFEVAMALEEFERTPVLHRDMSWFQSRDYFMEWWLRLQ